MSFVSNSKYAIELFREEHGRFPGKWTDLDPYLHGGIEGVGRYIQGTERYQIFGPPVSFSEPFEGKLVAISRRSFSDINHGWTWYGSIGERLGAPAYRGIILTGDDKLFQKTFSDAEMAQILISAGDLEIAADSLGERTHVASVRRAILLRKVFIAFGLGVFVIGAVKFIGRRRRHNKAAISSPIPSRVD